MCSSPGSFCVIQKVHSFWCLLHGAAWILKPYQILKAKLSETSSLYVCNCMSELFSWMPVSWSALTVHMQVKRTQSIRRCRYLSVSISLNIVSMQRLHYYSLGPLLVSMQRLYFTVLFGAWLVSMTLLSDIMYQYFYPMGCQALAKSQTSIVFSQENLCTYTIYITRGYQPKTMKQRWYEQNLSAGFNSLHARQAAQQSHLVSYADYLALQMS
jgi:hypothetical protein